MTIAVTREASSRFNECEITHIDRTPIDVQVARVQHRAYVRALKDLGCQVIELPEEPDLPDSVFVEDTAVILPEAAVITRPGAASRRPETESIVHCLSTYIPLLYITEPASLDGGDVLVLGHKIFIGLSTRSNPAAIEQLQQLVKSMDYEVVGVEIRDCLHLKTAVTSIDERTLLVNPEWIDMDPISGFDCVEADPSEPFAANCLPINGEVIFPVSFPKTRLRLEARGYKIRGVDVDELAKAEGAVTCCSLIFDHALIHNEQ